MCGRFFTGKDFRLKLNRLMESEEVSFDHLNDNEQRDVYPTDTSCVIRLEDGNLKADEMLWGFNADFLKRPVINARAESAFQKKMFKKSILEQRCVIPAGGFYEWNSDRQKFSFSVPERLLLLAGIYRLEDGVPHYVILTTSANDSMIDVHDRMPVMIEYEELRQWITDSSKAEYFLNRKQSELDKKSEDGQLKFDLEFE